MRPSDRPEEIIGARPLAGGDLEIPRWWVDTPHAGDRGAVERDGALCRACSGPRARGAPGRRDRAAHRRRGRGGVGALGGTGAGSDVRRPSQLRIAIGSRRGWIACPPGERTLPALLERQAEALGDRPFLQVGETPALVRRDARRGRAAGRARSPRPESRHGDRVALMAENRLEVLDAWFACAWLGAILVPFNTATRGPQLEHVLDDSGAARVRSVEARLLEQLDVSSACRPSSSASGCSTGAGERFRGVPLEPFPEPAGALAAADVRPGRHGRDPLHVGHDRARRRASVPAGAVLLVGAQHRGDARRALERRRALHVPAALPHERAQRVHPGAQPRRASSSSARASRPPASGRGSSRPTRPSRTCSARWSRSSRRRRRRRPSSEHRVRMALAPATPAELHELFRERFGVAAARRLRHDRDERRDRRASTASSARGRWGA